jgi:hypothetical protein
MERCLAQTTRGNFGSYNALNTLRGSVAQFARSLNTVATSRFRLARSKFGRISILCDKMCIFSHVMLCIVCPGWVIGNLEALAGAKSGHILAGM